MAQAARVDGFAVSSSSGAVSMTYTWGPPPLSPSPMNQGVGYSSVDAFVAALEALENDLSGEKLALIQAAKGWKTDPTFGPLFLQTIIGKTTTVDLTGIITPVNVG